MLNACTGRWAPENAGEDHVGCYPESDDEHPDVTLERQRAAAHAEYLFLTPRASPSIIGKYIVDCETLEKGYDNTDNLELTIANTPLPGIYQATFDFGILEGVMMLSADEYMLSYFSEKEFPPATSGTSGAAPASEVGFDSADEEEVPKARPAAGPKRKSNHENTSRPRKAAKAANGSSGSSGSKPTKLHLCMRSRDNGSGEINPDPYHGTIIANADFTVLMAKANIVCVGDTSFRARKVSDMPENSWARWEDYGHAACR